MADADHIARQPAAAASRTDLQAWLEAECAQLGEVELALLLRRTPDGDWEPEALFPLAESTIERATALLRLAGRSLAEACPLAEPEQGLLCFPLGDLAGEQWVFAARLGVRQERHLAACLRRLELSTAGVRARRLERLLEQALRGRERLFLAHRLLAVVAEQEDYQAAAQALVNELGAALQADRVSLGRVRDGRVSVVAISNSADVRRRQSQVEQLRLAMQEALEQGRALSAPPLDESAADALYREQQALADMVGGIQVLSFPLRAGDTCSEVLCVERPLHPRLEQEQVHFAEAVCSLAAPVLQDKARVARPLPALLKERAGEQLRRLLGAGYPGRKLLALGLAAVVAALVLVRLPFEVVAEARLEGEVQRALVAPFDGYVASAPLRAGDRVRKGELVARLDDADLRLERLRWESRLAQRGQELQAARAGGRRAELRKLQAEVAEARAELALIESRLQRTRLLAPFDAVIVEGDLSQRLGGAVKQGEALFRLAPLNRYRVVLSVPEEDLALLRVGQQGRLVFDAFPDRELPVRLARLSSESHIDQGQHLFRAEAVLAAGTPTGELRPGLEGLARIPVDERPLWQVLSERPLRWLRLKAWRWLP